MLITTHHVGPVICRAMFPSSRFHPLSLSFTRFLPTKLCNYTMLDWMQCESLDPVLFFPFHAFYFPIFSMQWALKMAYNCSAFLLISEVHTEPSSSSSSSSSSNSLILLCFPYPQLIPCSRFPFLCFIFMRRYKTLFGNTFVVSCLILILRLLLLLINFAAIRKRDGRSMTYIVEITNSEMMTKGKCFMLHHSKVYPLHSISTFNEFSTFLSTWRSESGKQRKNEEV